MPNDREDDHEPTMSTSQRKRLASMPADERFAAFRTGKASEDTWLWVQEAWWYARLLARGSCFSDASGLRHSRWYSRDVGRSEDRETQGNLQDRHYRAWVVTLG